MRKQQGFNLVELMVASLISLLLLTGVIQIFISSRASYHSLEGQATILENGRFALHVLSHHIRMAGLQNTDPYRLTQPNGNALLPAIDPSNTQENGDTDPDAIAVTYVNPDNVDCTGQTVAQPSTQRFEVKSDGNNNTSLFCNDVMIVEGVSNMQIEYGEDTSGNSTADRYLPYDQIGTGTIRTVNIVLTLYDARETDNKVASQQFNATILLRNN